MKKPLINLTKNQYEKLKSSGMMWEFYPDAPETYEKLLELKANQQKNINKSDRFNILFTLFIKPAMRALWIASDYPKERCAAKRLISLYPDFDFFYYITEYNEKFNSLLGLASKKMRPELDKKYKEYLNKKETNKVYILENEPVIDLEFKEKPKAKNLIELLDNL